MTAFDRAEEIAAWLGNLHPHQGPDETCAIRDRIMSAIHEEKRTLELQVRDLTDLLRKVDGVFENPSIVHAGDQLVLDIPYEVAAGVKGALLAKAPFFPAADKPKSEHTPSFGQRDRDQPGGTPPGPSPTEKLVPESRKLDGCPVCGARLTMIRGKVPGEPDRAICPTCAQERLEDLRQRQDPDYGRPVTDSAK